MYIARDIYVSVNYNYIIYCTIKIITFLIILFFNEYKSFGILDKYAVGFRWESCFKDFKQTNSNQTHDCGPPKIEFFTVHCCYAFNRFAEYSPLMCTH